MNKLQIKELDLKELSNVNGGGEFAKQLGNAVGTGLAYIAKGLSNVNELEHGGLSHCGGHWGNQ